MAIGAFRSQTNGGDATLGVSSINAPLPAGTAIGDLQIIIVSAGVLSPTAAPTVTTPTGWKLEGSATASISSGALNIRIHVFSKVATLSEGTVNLATTGAVNAAFGFGRLSYQNIDGRTPVGTPIFGSGGSTTAPVIGSITTDSANDILVAFLSQGAAQAATPPGSMTERIDDGTSGFEVADELQAVAGASGTRTFTLPTAADYAYAFFFLRSQLPGPKHRPALGHGPFAAGPFVTFEQPAPQVINGTLTQTLQDATLVATGTVKLQAALSTTLGNATLASTGTVSIAGALSTTLQDASAAGAGGLKVQGALNQTLGDATLSSTGTVRVAGTLSTTLADATLSAAATLKLQASLTQTLQDAVAAGAAGLKVQGTLTQTLGDATLAATGTLIASGTGTLTQTLQDATLISTGTLRIAGTTAVTLQDALAAGAAGLQIRGTLGATLADATLVSTATISQPGSGVVNVTLQDATLTATGVLSGTPAQTSGGGIAWYEREKRKAELQQRAQEAADAVPTEVVIEQEPGRPVVAAQLRTLRRAQAVHAQPIEVDRMPERVADERVAEAERATRIARDDDELLAMLGDII